MINPVMLGKLSVEDAYMLSRWIVSSPTRLMWQRNAGGRLYVDGVDSKLHYYRNPL
ncbi:MAG: hypothetical protein AAF974_01935 [Cyanobacteria bacterium P01_E01_bin.34]